MARAVVRAVATEAGAGGWGQVHGGAGDGSGAHHSTFVNARPKPSSLRASACPLGLSCTEAIAAGERWTVITSGSCVSVKGSANTSGTMRTFATSRRESTERRECRARVARALAGYRRRVRCEQACSGALCFWCFPQDPYFRVTRLYKVATYMHAHPCAPIVVALSANLLKKI